MSIYKNFKGLFRIRDQPETQEKEIFDYNFEKKPMYEEDIVEFINSELKRRKSERRPMELQWNLNCNFLAGNQYCDINTHKNSIEQYVPVYDYLEREVFNQISPLIETRIAYLKRINFIMNVNPYSNELDDYEKAQISTSVLRHLQTVSNFDKRKDNMLLWCELTGSAFVLSWWDNLKGEVVAKQENEDGKIESIYDGDVEYGLLSPYEIYPESIFKENISEQRSIIVEQVMNVDDIYDRYGIRCEGENIDTFSLSPISGAGGFGYEASVMSLQSIKKHNSKVVITYFERKNKIFPNGRLIIVIGDRVITYSDLPYDEIPIVIMKSKEVAGQFFGKSTIQDLIPLQRAYNGCMNSIHDYIKSLTVGGWIAEDGAIDVDEYTENGTAPGSILTYRKGYNPPRPMDNAALPDAVTYECQKLRSDMEYVAGVSQLMVIGSTPSGITSGTAIESLREIDNTRLSLTGDNIRNAILQLSKMWLSIIKKHASGYRIIKTSGKNSIGGALTWCSEDINSYDVKFDTVNELVISEETQKEEFLRAYGMGLFTDENGKITTGIKSKMLELMKLNNYGEILSINDLQISAAKRENSFMKLGILPIVSKIDDHYIHIEEHKRYALQIDFLLLKKHNAELANLFLEHIENHENQLILQNKNNPQERTNNENGRTKEIV